MAIDISGFGVNEFQPKQSNVIPELRQQMLEKQRYDYLLAKDKEADQWKKIGLIQDLTDLSKHQSGSDVANALGNQKANEIFQKYVGAAANMNPNELAANIQREMGGLVTSMDGVKNELDNADKQVAELKKIYPNLDLAALTKDYRADIVNRHLKNGSEFNNPVEVQPTSINLSDPRFLSKYMPNTKTLDEMISNPKGLDPTEVLVGNPYENITYKGKVPFWRQPNFTDEERAKNQGYLKNGFVPSLDIKSENLPSEFLPALKNNPRKMVSDDVYKQFYGADPIGVEKATADMFGDVYDKMNDHEKELAQKDMLYTKISALDKSNFYPSSSTHPSASIIKLFNGDSGGSGKKTGEVNVNDVFGEIRDAAKGNPYIKPHILSSQAQGIVLDVARKAAGDNTLSSQDIRIKYQPDGNVYVYKKVDGEDEQMLSVLNDTSVNLKAQPGVKEKREVIKQSQHKPQKHDDPLGILE